MGKTLAALLTPALTPRPRSLTRPGHRERDERDEDRHPHPAADHVLPDRVDHLPSTALLMLVTDSWARAPAAKFLGVVLGRSRRLTSVIISHRAGFLSSMVARTLHGPGLFHHHQVCT